MRLIDSHCHLDFPDFADELDAVVEREPVLVRISAAKRIRDAAERGARRAGEASVSARRLADAISESRGG